MAAAEDMGTAWVNFTALGKLERIMPTSIAREEVQRLIREEAALLVEVLPSQEYQDEHIEGSINLPLKRLNKETAGGLDKARPVIVY